MGDSNGAVNKKAALVDARAARAELRRIDYEQRKADGRCTVAYCRRMACDVTSLCPECHERQRANMRAAAKARRDEAREAGRCFDCGAKSTTCRCVDCQIRFGRIAKRTLARLIADSNRAVNKPVLATTIERDSRYPDGRVRTRYRGGQGRRGAPSRLTVTAADVALALACLRRAHEKLEALCNIEDKRERQAAKAAAMGQVSLAGRMIDEVMDRDAG